VLMLTSFLVAGDVVVVVVMFMLSGFLVASNMMMVVMFMLSGFLVAGNMVVVVVVMFMFRSYLVAGNMVVMFMLDIARGFAMVGYSFSRSGSSDADERKSNNASECTELHKCVSRP
jgi:hypothetical protein